MSPQGPEPRTAQALPWPERIRTAPVTVSLVLLCGLLFAVTLGVVAATAEDPAAALFRSLWSIESDQGLRQLGALELPRIWIHGEWWRLGTAALLHGSWLHLVLNLSALWSIGEWLEPAVGSPRTLLIFAVSALGASLASLLWCEAPVVVGASGGILGLAGALLYARLCSAKLNGHLRDISATSLAVMIGLCLGLGLVVPMIAQAGHVGGLLAGTLTAAALLSVGLVRILWVSLLLAALTTSVIVGERPESRANYHLYLGFAYLDEGEDGLALSSFEAALDLRPDDPTLANAVAYHLSLAGTELERADALADQALRDEPDNADYLDTKGWIACRQGRVDDGLRWLESAAQAAPKEIAEVAEHRAQCGEAGPR